MGRRQTCRLQALLLGLALVALQAEACTLRVAQLERPHLTAPPANTAPEGFEGELVQALGRRAACQLQWRWVSLRGAWRAMENGEIDLLPGALVTPERERHALLVPLVTVSTVLLVPEGADDALTPAALLAQPAARVLRLRGGAYAPAVGAWLDELAALGRVDEVGDYRSALRLLRAGRALGFPLSAALLPTDAIPGVRVLEAWPAATTWAGFAISRRTVPEPERLRLQAALQDLLRDGSVQALLQRHYGEAARRRMRPAVPGRASP